MEFEEYIRYQRRDAAAEAAIETRIESVLELLTDYGHIPEDLERRIRETRDLDTLKKWHKLAAKVNSMEEFEANC